MVVPGKFLAFRGPSRSSLQPTDFLQVFKTLGVHSIVRLNKAEYHKSDFVDAGFEHHDMFFEDCSVPSSRIVDRFLRCAESLEAGQVMAVHCLAGLGRTGTLIALFMMKHYGFTADEAMGWLRVCRPGSIIGPQQRYLTDQEGRMHELGALGASGLGKTLHDPPVSHTASSPSNYNTKEGILQSKVLAEMVNTIILSLAYAHALSVRLSSVLALFSPCPLGPWSGSLSGACCP